MATSRATKFTVAIIGSGLTGLVAAHGLRKAGYNVVIFDRAPSLTHSRPGREVRDWTILVHWGLPLMRERLLSPDVAARLDAALCDPTLDYGSAADKIETFPCYDGASGKLLFASPTPGARRFSRQRLRSVLLDGLDNVRWGKCLTNIEAPAAGDELGGKATLRFEDGSSFTADFVLGADGTASRVCEILLGEEVGRPSRTGLMFATGYCNYGDPTKVAAVTGVHPVAAIMLGPGICAAVGTLYASAQAETLPTIFWVKIYKDPSSDPKPLRGAAAIEHIKATTDLGPESADVCEPFRSAIAWTPEGSECYVDEMRYWVPVSWANNTFGGRVTLVGDAAHPMLPFRGQGFQHAIQDCVNYVEMLAKIEADPSTISAAMAAFDGEIVERGAAAVLQANAEAEKALNPASVAAMQMARQGHVRTA